MAGAAFGHGSHAPSTPPLPTGAERAAHHHSAHPHGHSGSPGHAPKATPDTTAPPLQQPWGTAGDVRRVDRTVTIHMTDNMRFDPAHLEVREGETLRLRAVNRGQVLHEIVLGTRDTLQDHARHMAAQPGMAHNEPYMAHVAAGQQGDLVWQFNRVGRFEFACLIPGHFQAGMTGTITVQARKP